EVGGIGVHIVPAVRLARAPVTAAVMGDHAIALTQEEHHLSIPVVRAERPTVAECDYLRLFWSPVFVKDLGTVSGGDEWHGGALPLVCGFRPAGPVPKSDVADDRATTVPFDASDSQRRCDPLTGIGLQ